MKKIKIERTKKGFPALWECGGGFTNTGEATIIASSSGGPKRAIYIRSRGPLANGRHALIPVEVGDYVIEADHHREDFEITIHRIINFEEETAVVEQVYEFSMGEWDKEPPAHLEQAVHTAMFKATCYHCREPHFIAE
jgi:hypothetical protein